jgi:hypothetical protein
MSIKKPIRAAKPRPEEIAFESERDLFDADGHIMAIRLESETADEIVAAVNNSAAAEETNAEAKQVVNDLLEIVAHCLCNGLSATPKVVAARNNACDFLAGLKVGTWNAQAGIKEPK